MNSIILPCLVLAVALAIADSKHKGKCGGDDVPLCALVYDRKAPPIPPLKPDCSKCVAEAHALLLTDNTIWIPACNKDDSFKKEQYDADKNESFCATPYGEEVGGTRVKGKIIRCKKDKGPVPSKCQAARAKAKRTKAKHVPACNKAGEYHHIQYFNTKSPFGWCALKSGKPVPDSFFTKSKKRTPNCRRHRVTKLECKDREGMVKHPFDCKRYLQCGADTVYTCICPHGQAFNTSLKVCDRIDNVKGCPPTFMARKPHASPGKPGKMKWQVDGSGGSSGGKGSGSSGGKGGGGDGGTCKDQSTSCYGRASKGECTSTDKATREYMVKKCAKSCKVCSGKGGGSGGGTCKDQSTRCADWASDGQCQKNPAYMLEKCAKSCGQCSGGSTSKCVDNDRQCWGWAQAGFCKAKNREGYMRLNCAKSCKFC